MSDNLERGENDPIHRAVRRYLVNSYTELDEGDPIRRAMRRYLINIYVGSMVLLVLGLATLVVGLPHIQGDYSYQGPRSKGGMTAAFQKTDAWYLSITGWQQVEAGQYGHEGCPYFLFIPVSDCVDLSNPTSIFPISLFFKE